MILLMILLIFEIRNAIFSPLNKYPTNFKDITLLNNNSVIVINPQNFLTATSILKT